MHYQDILTFWFEECTPEDWFSGDETIDTKIKERFETSYHAIVAGECADWRETADGALAEILVLDQFSRNMFRGTAQVFAADPLALALAQEMIRRGQDNALDHEQRRFVYMPFMHSESKQIHEVAVTLFGQLGDEESLRYEQKHKDIIDRFGRYPHRNKQLNRQMTDEEQVYLDANEEGFFNS